ncbi:hypothetical protein [Rhodanobacter sp. L36]|uniref:hypothetical protein n=1 Tax=Rhodanobacter sp. L36 TaxID=1747221 RepID=UPI00131AE4AB|nr:hypothetical protein [Rhodanobacter sp. L36]
MSQNLVSLTLTPEQLTAIDAALTVLESNLAGLIALQPSQRRELFKMGEKSEQFARQTLNVLANNPQIVPASLGLADAQADMAALDALRPRLQRMKQLVERGEDTEMALGSDIMNTSLEGYGQLKLSGKNQGLDGMRQELSSRFAKTRQPVVAPTS